METDIYTVVAEPTGSPMYVVGNYSSEELAKEKVFKTFGAIAKQIETLPGSGLATICQFRFLSTIISICLCSLDDEED